MHADELLCWRTQVRQDTFSRGGKTTMQQGDPNYARTKLVQAVRALATVTAPIQERLTHAKVFLCIPIDTQDMPNDRARQELLAVQSLLAGDLGHLSDLDAKLVANKVVDLLISFLEVSAHQT